MNNFQSLYTISSKVKSEILYFYKFYYPQNLQQSFRTSLPKESIADFLSFFTQRVYSRFLNFFIQRVYGRVFEILYLQSLQQIFELLYPQSLQPSFEHPYLQSLQRRFEALFRDNQRKSVSLAKAQCLAELTAFISSRKGPQKKARYRRPGKCLRRKLAIDDRESA